MLGLAASKQQASRASHGSTNPTPHVREASSCAWRRPGVGRRRLRALRAFPEADEVALDIVHDDFAEFAATSHDVGGRRGALVRRGAFVGGAFARPNDVEPVYHHQTIANRPGALSDWRLLTGCTRARAKNGESVHHHFAELPFGFGIAIHARGIRGGGSVASLCGGYGRRCRDRAGLSRRGRSGSGRHAGWPRTSRHQPYPSNPTHQHQCTPRQRLLSAAERKKSALYDAVSDCAQLDDSERLQRRSLRKISGASTARGGAPASYRQQEDIVVLVASDWRERRAARLQPRAACLSLACYEDDQRRGRVPFRAAGTSALMIQQIRGRDRKVDTVEPELPSPLGGPARDVRVVFVVASVANDEGWERRLSGLGSGRRRSPDRCGERRCDSRGLLRQHRGRFCLSGGRRLRLHAGRGVATSAKPGERNCEASCAQSTAAIASVT